MEDDLNFALGNLGICFLVYNIVSTQVDEIWKTTYIFFENRRRPHFFLKIEDDLNFLTMEDNLKFLKMQDELIFLHWKTTSFFEKGRQPHFFENGR